MMLFHQGSIVRYSDRLWEENNIRTQRAITEREAPFAGGGAFNAQEARAAADGAANAFYSWSRSRAATRISILQQAAEVMLSRQDEGIEIASRETRSSPDWARFNIEIAVNTLRQTAELAGAVGETDTRPGYLLRRRPAGVVLGFAPWNAPIALATRAVAAPLACGNTAVLKGSELCPETHAWVARILNLAGLPERVLNFVSNPPDLAGEVAEALISHPAVRRVNFTGSTRIGRNIAMTAARHLKPCLLELSGKGAMIVRADADLAHAAVSANFGAFFNQGQICMSTERIIVADAVADAFVGALHEEVERNPQGGALISPVASERVRELIDDALDRGAQLVCGGTPTVQGMVAAVLDHVTPGMRIYREEIFGPVACIIRVADDEEALAIANDTDFGLVASVFSANTAEAAEMLSQIEVGVGHVNGSTVFDNPALPFGGVKASGYGRFGGIEAVHEFTELQWIAVHDHGDPRHVPDLTE